MASRADKRFIGNLPQLQNLIKRDPITYEAEFAQQLSQFDSFVQIFGNNPNEDHSHFDSLIMFLAHVSFCYPKKSQDFADRLFTFLRTKCQDLSWGTRQALCKGLMLLHKRDVIDVEKLLPLFFELLKIGDKHLRELLSTQIVSVVKAINAKHRDQKVNSRIQKLFLDQIKLKHSVVSVVALESAIHLYKKGVWKEQKVVNIIGEGCFLGMAKLLNLSLRFFTSTNDSKQDEDNADSDSEMKTAKELITTHRVGKKTSKRQKRLERGMRQIKKNAKKEKKEVFDFSALHLLYDPQEFAERLYRVLNPKDEHEGKKDKASAASSETLNFDTKLLLMDFISRLIGLHKLVVLNYYPYFQKFMQPHQREITKILMYVAQSSHEMIPPDVVQSVVKTVADNFVTDRNSTEVITVGLNSIREICARCPFAMTSDLLHDLAQYRKYRNKNVMSAARSLVQLYRHVDPSLLKRRDRGRPNVATQSLKRAEFGEDRTVNAVEGAELLPLDEKDVEEEGADGWESDSNEEEDDEDGEWVDVQSDFEEPSAAVINPEVEELSEAAKNERAVLISSTRFLSQKEFETIKKQKLADILAPSRGKKRSATFAGLDGKEPTEFVSLSDIERLTKRLKETKADKMAGAKVAREDRGEYGRPKPKLNPHASTTNKQKSRKKNFMMIRQKVRGKQKRSFRDKQMSFRNALVKQSKRN
ncbi:hypothetical protein RvY_18811 [Ramazzottius varieornatus]|uniref:Protein SDA1 n=1 Tax=Ramazzottius varieornatus TaxID=947166 RepID=A0A1D1WA08_RAMVA|nr:hypothetical protein RvY_18811 [Ramazzottius varieornatus]